jgi:hypothetical protein
MARSTIAAWRFLPEVRLDDRAVAHFTMESPGVALLELQLH